MRRRLVWYKNYQRAMGKTKLDKPEVFWQRWLDDEKDGPQLDNFSVPVSEQTESHVILRAINNAAQNELGKNIDRYPGLVLKPSTHRFYPFGPVACHLMGRVSKVSRDDLSKDPEKSNEIRQYAPNDEIGRGGVEALCERALRGYKGTVLKVLGEKEPIGHTDPISGKDVRITIDMELQAKIEDAFAHAELVESDGSIEHAVLHGAAIVIDVPTGEVRALVSYPTYDLNTLDEHYAELYYNQIDMPLLNRATMSQLAPGSTVKPVVGLSAITAGIFGANETIECKGYMYANGKPIMNANRCWVASKFTVTLGGNVAHHPVPWDAPHPTGFLTFADALERSCNVFFQTLAERFGMEQLSVWYEKFGMGRPTGIGIAEARGKLPRSFGGPVSQLRSKLWFSGIGQDPVAVTPIQMANNAATIARNGIWMRPRLVSDQVASQLHIVTPLPATRPSSPVATPIPNWVDLHLSPAGLAEAHEGMFRVVYSKAGTGTQILRGATMFGNFKICGKTGTATASKYAIKMLDSHHQPILSPSGNFTYRFLEPSTKDHPNPDAPWYRGYGADGKDLNHAWYIGFAPAEHPKVAFAVMVEYGGSGGGTGGAVARKVLEACITEGYLP
jgi:penicillin-binding protein 2